MSSLRLRKPSEEAATDAVLDRGDGPTNVIHRRRWRLAFTVIYFTRALESLSKQVLGKKTELLRTISYVAINVDLENSDNPREGDCPSLRDVSPKILSNLMRRTNIFGANKYNKPPAKSFLSFVLDAFKDMIIIILIACAVLSLAFGIKQHGLKEGWYDGGSIIIAIFLVVIVSAVSNYKQGKQFRKLSKESSNIRVEVVRDGRRQPISIFDIVVGDVVYLKIGDQVPADGLFVDGHSLRVDESSMTGESDHIEVDRENPFLLSGTKVIDGYGQMMVASVGMNTAWGEMMSSVSRDLDEETPLQARLNKLTSLIGKVGVSVAVLVLLVSMIRYFTGHTQDDAGNREFTSGKTKSEDVMDAVVRIVAAAVTIVVVAIPEGLPLAVTLTLAYSMKRMMGDNAMVRKLSACETMGSATTILLGIVGIKDPCRPGVRRAVVSCRSAGVTIKMITGDNMHTARAIALECGIFNPEEDLEHEAIVEGVQFRNYLPEQRAAAIEKIRVMARSSPFDKLLMVQCLKQKGHVVAVTGDGTNDAPALKEADIGLSMGIQGTEVAKESSDIVILDDNFASVVTVLRWGRCVYNNIQKFIQFQLTVNVAALVINFVAAVSSGDVPLTAVQLLWVNLIMDTLGALALATEQPTNDLMLKPPVGRTEPLISGVMWRNLVSQALYQVIILLTLQFKGSSIFGVDKKVRDTIIFNCFVLCQVFNEFNARKLEEKNIFKGVHKNKLFLGIISMTIILQVVMVEFLKRFANTERLDWVQWGACIGLAALSWPIGWLVKCIPVSGKKLFFSRREEASVSTTSNPWFSTKVEMLSSFPHSFFRYLQLS